MEESSSLRVNVKSEPFSPEKKAYLAPNALIPPNLVKKEPSTTRLPSFKPPRDLSLCGSTKSQSLTTLKLNISTTNKSNKRVYAPNIHVTRRKGTSNTSGSESTHHVDSKNKGKEKGKKVSPVKKRSVNVVQTQGVFSEGLAPGKVRTFHNDNTQNESHVMTKPKLNLNRIIVKKNEDSKLKSLLKDDFIDDPNMMPDITFNPSSLPKVYNVKKNQLDSPNLDRTFESLQVKMEKVENLKMEDKYCRSEVLSAFGNTETPKMILFEFPPSFTEKEEVPEKKKPSKSTAKEPEMNSTKTKSGSLTSLGEGLWGCLRIHENGNAYFVIGKNAIPVVLTRHLTRQEVMSTSIDPAISKGEVINLGTIDATFTCSTNFFRDVR